MSRVRVTGQYKMALRYGTPEPGMAWCSGYECERHQVPVDQIYPKTCRCKKCRSRCNEQYRHVSGKRVDNRPYRGSPSEADVRYIEPGRLPPRNDGIPIPLPSWGYGRPETSRRRTAPRYVEAA